jgi:hypothetical protein
MPPITGASFSPALKEGSNPWPPFWSLMNFPAIAKAFPEIPDFRKSLRHNTLKMASCTNNSIFNNFSRPYSRYSLVVIQKTIVCSICQILMDYFTIFTLLSTFFNVFTNSFPSRDVINGRPQPHLKLQTTFYGKKSFFLNLSCCCLETGLKPVLFFHISSLCLPKLLTLVSH